MTPEQAIRLELLRMALAHGLPDPEAFTAQWADWVITGHAKPLAGHQTEKTPDGSAS